MLKLDSQDSSILQLVLPDLATRIRKSRWSLSLAAFGTRTKFDNLWRLNHLIKATQFPVKIDLFTSKCGWAEAVITSVKCEERGDSHTTVYSGECRLLQEKGHRETCEWVQIYSPRIMPHLSHCTPFQTDLSRRFMINKEK